MIQKVKIEFFSGNEIHVHNVQQKVHIHLTFQNSRPTKTLKFNRKDFPRALNAIYHSLVLYF